MSVITRVVPVAEVGVQVEFDHGRHVLIIPFGQIIVLREHKWVAVDVKTGTEQAILGA
jgi:hypothetical protein